MYIEVLWFTFYPFEYYFPSKDGKQGNDWFLKGSFAILQGSGCLLGEKKISNLVVCKQQSIDTRSYTFLGETGTKPNPFSWRTAVVGECLPIQSVNQSYNQSVRQSTAWPHNQSVSQQLEVCGYS